MFYSFESKFSQGQKNPGPLQSQFTRHQHGRQIAKDEVLSKDENHDITGHIDNYRFGRVFQQQAKIQQDRHFNG